MRDFGRSLVGREGLVCFLLAWGVLACLLGAALNVVAVAEARDRSIPVPPLPAPVPEIVRGVCPAHPLAVGCFYARGLDDRSAPRIYLGIHDVGTTLHELGHAYSAQRVDEGNRRAIMHAIGWWGVWHEEGFAELYVACRLQRRPLAPWTSGVDYYGFSARRVPRVCGVIARAFWR